MGDQRDVVKCCLCRQPVEASGWCGNCDRWPINVTPIRYCRDCQGRVDPDGLCLRCVAMVASRLEPRRGQWADTGEVNRLLGREENQRRMRTLMLQLDQGGPVRIAEAFLPAFRRQRQDHAAVADQERTLWTERTRAAREALGLPVETPEAEEVPF